MPTDKTNPPLFWSNGAKTTNAKNPYATEGIAAKTSIIGLIICLNLNESRSLRQTAADIPNGTHTIIDPKTTIALPTKIDSAPNSSGWPDGYHRVEVKNSLNPSMWKNGNASLKIK